MEEVWLSVSGYEGHYWVSNLGRIKSKFKILAPSVSGNYAHVTLSVGNEKTTHRVHVLVLASFCGDAPFPGAQAAHNDGNSLNNRLTNLRWASTFENQADVERHGRRCKGVDVYGAVLTDADVREIRKRTSNGERNRPIAEDYGVSISTIHLIRHEKTWRHVS